jgi:hypothetical protein
VRASRRSSCAREVMRPFYTRATQPNLALEPSVPSQKIIWHRGSARTLARRTNLLRLVAQCTKDKR